MQDVRIRTGCAVILSLSAFSGVTGAAAVFVWWLIFAHPLRTVKKIRFILSALGLIAFFGLILELTGGEGLAYSVRMIAVVLTGSWLYTEYRPGDFLHLGTWLFGKNTGFELGLTVELAMQAVGQISADADRIRQAQELKGLPWGVRSLVPAGIVLVRNALQRAEDAAELLAARGYIKGGSFCPVFTTAKTDILAGSAALCTGLIAFIPVSEFFILYH